MSFKKIPHSYLFYAVSWIVFFICSSVLISQRWEISTKVSDFQNMTLIDGYITDSNIIPTAKFNYKGNTYSVQERNKNCCYMIGDKVSILVNKKNLSESKFLSDFLYSITPFVILIVMIISVSIFAIMFRGRFVELETWETVIKPFKQPTNIFAVTFLWIVAIGTTSWVFLLPNSPIRFIFIFFAIISWIVFVSHIRLLYKIYK